VLPKAPNPAPAAAEAARLLDAAVLNWFLLMVIDGLVEEQGNGPQDHS
jgi:hypothetical protein